MKLKLNNSQRRQTAQKQSEYNRDALIFRVLEIHKIELQSMSNKQLVNAWKFVMACGPEEEPEPEDAYDESIKVLAEDLVKRAKKEGFTVTPKGETGDDDAAV
jgi:hypothetical protein